MDIRLQPLRIPTGWCVGYNNGLWEVDPVDDSVPAEDRWRIFKQDMLQLQHPRFNRMLDVGWYPEGDVTAGHYQLMVYEGNFKGTLLHKFETRDRHALVVEIERLMDVVCAGKL